MSVLFSGTTLFETLFRKMGLAEGWQWVMLKNLACGIGTGVIGFYRGLAPKQSASDVSNAITSTVLWTTLYVLLVHFVIALLEF